MLLLALLAACRSTTSSPSLTDTPATHSAEPSTTPPGGSGHTDSIVPAGHTGHTAAHTGFVSPSHSASPTHSGPVDLASLLPGVWRPTAVDGTPVADDPRRYWVFDPSGDLARGCGRPSTGTWTFQETAPAPAIGLIDAQLGPVPLQWYVVTLTATELVYVEGGDVFEHVRTSCPP